MNDSVQHLLINVGSVDIAEGRELIEMIHDLRNLLNTCDRMGIYPILTTLPPLPNHMLGNKRDILKGFNEVLKQRVSQEYAVIDLNKVMVKPDDTSNLNLYQPIPRKLSGSKQALVMWNNLGRKRILTMIIKNLRNALFFDNFLFD
jgi:maternal effect protein oskar